MVRMLYCTGKKKNVTRMIQFFESQAKAGVIKILAKEVESKTKLLRQFEVLRLLFDKAGEQKINLDEELLRSMDYITYTTKGTVYIKMSSFKVEDNWLKWNIKEATFDFQTRGGQLEIDEETEALTSTRKLRICHYTLKGPLSYATLCRDQLIGANLGDPKTIQYFLPTVSQLEEPRA